MIAHKSAAADMFRILVISLVLTLIGLIFIYSSSSVFAFEKHASSIYYVRKQLFGFCIALCALIIARAFPFEIIKKHALSLFLASLALTMLTLVPQLSRHVHGSSRWLSIAGFSFQPSELLKIGLILYLARFLSKKQFAKKSFVNCYVPFLIVMGIVSIILLRQPDFGLMVTLMATACCMLFVAQVPLKYLAFTALSSAPVFMLLIVMRPYRLKRILTFLNPWNDPRGAGFQIIQSLIAIGSGSIWGVGIGQSKQKFFYLPMLHTDFIVSIIAEETGLIGTSLILGLFLLFLYYGLRMATHLEDSFSMLACTGFISLIGLQAGINIAVASGLVPTKGIGLPFISYGNTGLVCLFAMLGLMLNMVHHNRQPSVGFQPITH